MLLGAAFNLQTFCTEAKEILTFVGWALTIFKVAIPFIIIAYGIMDLGKAVTAAKDGIFRIVHQKFSLPDVYSEPYCIMFSLSLIQILIT